MCTFFFWHFCPQPISLHVPVPAFSQSMSNTEDRDSLANGYTFSRKPRANKLLRIRTDVARGLTAATWCHASFHFTFKRVTLSTICSNTKYSFPYTACQSIPIA